MNTIVDIRSTPELEPRQAFEQWEGALSESFLPMGISNPQPERFHGRARFATYDSVDVGAVRATPHRVYRSRRHLDQPDEPAIVAFLPTAGPCQLDMSGRLSAVEPGALFIYDSSQPMASYHGSAWGVTLAGAPLSSIVERTGLPIGRLPINARLPTVNGAVGVIERFFRGLLAVQQTDPAAAEVLGAHAIDLVASAILLTSGTRLAGQPAQALARQQVLEFIRNHYTETDLTTDRIAHACAVSRRTLYRLFEDVEGGVGATLRRCRIDAAQAWLRADRVLSLESIAAVSGFASDRHFYRVFKQQTGMTPGEYRALQHSADRPLA
ncbi:helix-turn-helix domain-containing protein [Nocardia sp. BMG51109]|uniref:helix-turn-helix domain-containing protein n=1 Tax=Nocardia sp. BMG51109 TaxID=1056816 RepID=UPI0004670472|nr:helix-turn-helix domain-containing protein [Nocardia sp. BMG51109]